MSPAGTARDRITLSGVRGRGFHGVFEHERREGQEFVVDVELAVDLGPAGRSDDLADTVNYGEVGAAVLARIEGEPHDLVERLAELVADDALAHDAVDEVVVTVHKPQAPVGVPFGDVSVRLVRRREPVPVVVAVGANLPWGSSSPADTVASAVEALAHHPAVGAVRASAPVETEPVGGPDQPRYVNAVVLARTSLSPTSLLRELHALEAAFDRTREVRWGARTLDLDLVQYGDPAAGTDVVSGRERLTLPHPRAHERGFVLVPWLDADPDAVLRHDGAVVRVADLVEQVDVTGISQLTDDGRRRLVTRNGIRVQTFVLVAAVTAVLGFGVAVLVTRDGSLLQRPPWAAGVLLVVMGGLVVWLARPVRHHLRSGRRTSYDALRAARTVVLAQAAALTGAAAAGWYLGSGRQPGHRPRPRRQPAAPRRLRAAAPGLGRARRVRPARPGLVPDRAVTTTTTLPPATAADRPAGRRGGGLLVDVADDEEHRAEHRDEVGEQAPGQHLGEHLDVAERGGPQLEPPRRLLAAGHEVVPVEAQRVLGRRVALALGHLEHLREALVHRAGGQRAQPVEARLGEVEADVHLLEQHLEAGEAVALGAGDDAAGSARREELGVGEVRVVAAQVEVDAAGPGDGSRDAVVEHACRRRARRRRGCGRGGSRCRRAATRGRAAGGGPRRPPGRRAPASPRARPP